MFENKLNDNQRKSIQLNKANTINIENKEDVVGPESVRNRSSSIIEKLKIFNNNLNSNSFTPQSSREIKNDPPVINQNKYIKVFDEKKNRYIWVENETVNNKEIKAIEEQPSELNIDSTRLPVVEDIVKKFSSKEETIDDVIDEIKQENSQINVSIENKEVEKEHEFESEIKEQPIVDLIHEKETCEKVGGQYNEIINSSLINPESVINISNLNVNHNNYNSIFQTLRSNQFPTETKESEIIEKKQIKNDNSNGRMNKIYLGIIIGLVIIILVLFIK